MLQLLRFFFVAVMMDSSTPPANEQTIVEGFFEDADADEGASHAPFEPISSVRIGENFEESQFYGLDEAHPQVSDTLLIGEDDAWFLHERDRRSISTIPSLATVEEWKSCPVSDVGEAVTFTINNATQTAWEQAKEEILHLRSHVHALLKIDPSSPE